jgi:hypothetical protein
VSERVQVIPVIVSEPFYFYGTDSFARSLAGARPSSGKDLEGYAPRVRAGASATGNSERAILVYGTDSLARSLAGARPSSGKDLEGRAPRVRAGASDTGNSERAIFSLWNR